MVIARTGSADPDNDALTYRLWRQGGSLGNALRIDSHGQIMSTPDTWWYLYNNNEFTLCAEATDPVGVTATHCWSLATY